MSASSATRWPNACSITAGWKPIQQRFPEHDLVFRNLGFSGDEITIRLRSAGFGTPRRVADENQDRRRLCLLRLQRIVRRQGGLANFKNDLDAFVKHTLEQKYNGTARPRSCCSRRSPTRICTNRNLPDGKENNERLKLYTAAMGEVAKANDVVFVDLFTPTHELYARPAQPLTINGIHLTERWRPAGGRDHRQGPVRPRPSGVQRPRLEKLRRGARQEFPLVQPLSHRGWLFDLRRPGRSAQFDPKTAQTNREVMPSARWKSST